MKILIGCEFSQIVTAEFRKRGHEAYSCDVLPTEGNPEWHYKGDIFEAIKYYKPDILIVFPPCPYLCSSGIFRNKNNPERQKKTEKALIFVEKLLNCSVPKIALENPVGIISTRIRKPDQIIQPYEFGEDASKKTCLWLKNLEPLSPTKYIPGRIINGKQRWSNQTDSGQNKLTPSEDRWKLRSKTFQGIAEAMANQWGSFVA